MEAEAKQPTGKLEYIEPIEYNDDDNTIDAVTDSEINFNSNSNQSFDEADKDHSNDSEILTVKPCNKRSALMLELPNYIDDLNKINVLSPISELALNVAKSKLNSSYDSTGKFIKCLIVCLFAASTH